MVRVTLAMARKLPEEMIEEVVLRLPAKSVGRFRCASKAWRCRLSNPKFVKAHFNFHIDDGGPVSIIFEHDHYHYERLSANHHGHLLTCDADGGAGKLVTSPFFDRGRFGQITASASIYGVVVVGIAAFEEHNLCLFNPITLEAVKLPHFQSSNPHECMQYVGIGCDTTSHDYKIVRLSCSEYREERKYEGTFVDVYSFKMKSWRKLGKSPYIHAVIDHPCPGVFLNGCLHWLAWDNEGNYVTAVFNLAKEEFEQVHYLPPEGSYGKGEVVEGSDDSCEEYGFDNGFEGFDESCQVIALGGCLAVVCPVYNTFRMEVWVMREYGVQESWNKLVIDTDRRFIHNFVCLLREDEAIFRQSFKDNNQLAAYSLSTKVWRNISIDATDLDDSDECLRIEEHIGLVAYKECLLSPNHILD